MIRKAEMTDLNELLDMAGHFAAEANEELDDKTFLIFAASLILGRVSGTIFVIDTDGVATGMMGLLASPKWFNTNKVTVDELFWYVHPEHRGGRDAIRLFEKAEEYATSVGASDVKMAATQYTVPEKVERLYLRRGFHKQETFYRKDLPCQVQ